MLIGPTSQGERIVVGAAEAGRRLAERAVRFDFVDPADEVRAQLVELSEELGAANA